MPARTVAAIVGAGHAGGRAVEALLGAGWRGAIVLVGNEPHLPYERPPLSKEFLTGRVSMDAARVAPPAFYREHDIDVRLNVSATEIDIRSGRLHLSDGGTVPYDRLLLATGASPRRLTVPGAESDRIRYLRTEDDAVIIRQRLRPGSRLLVVGAGLIGLEVAASARQGDCQVTVVEGTDTVLGRVAPPEIADLIARLHNERGVDIHLEAPVATFESTDGRVTAVCVDGSRLDADLVVAGIGALPETGLAEAAGIRCTDGILVDERCQTSAPGVFAAGDAARRFNRSLGIDERLECWQNAQDQARCAARAMVGLPEPYHPIPYIWTDQYGMKLQIAGRWRADDSVMRGSVEAGRFLVFYLSGSTIVGVLGVNSPRDFALARRLVGGAGPSPDKAELACESLPLKQLVVAQ